MIAGSSILSAVVAWRASVASGRARDLDERAAQELVLEEQEEAWLQGIVTNDLRYFVRYEERIFTWRLLQQQADSYRGPDPNLAKSLEVEANAELALARSLRKLFLGGTPDFGDADGTVVYDRKFALDQLRSVSQTLNELDPERTRTLAGEERDRTLRLVAVFTLVVLALLFLTVAQFAPSAIRGTFAVLGGSVSAFSLVALVLMESRVL